MEADQYRTLQATLNDTPPPVRDTLLFLALTASNLIVGALFSHNPSPSVLWFVGQILIAIGLVQCFVILHEAGHGTLLPNRVAQKWIGHCAGLLVGIPFLSWKYIHNGHHVWTGWRDLDPTTANLCGRSISSAERSVLRLCWRFFVPVFSVLYRISIYWSPNHLRKFARQQFWPLAGNVLVQGGIYAGLACTVGPQLISFYLVAMLLHLAILDPILISQHSHVPQERSLGNKVRPFASWRQEKFTRSLAFPRFFSKWVLLNFDYHELHHIFPRVPALLLDAIDYTSMHRVSWDRWVWQSKRIPVEILILTDRRESGFDI